MTDGPIAAAELAARARQIAVRQRAQAARIVADRTRRALTADGKLRLGSRDAGSGAIPREGGGTGHDRGAEPPLGNPATDGRVLSSSAAGVRSWVDSLTAEQVRDLVAAFLVAGSNVTIAHDDAGDALTIAAAGGATNLTATPSPTAVVVASDTGTDATIAAADATNAGAFLPGEKSKLAGVEAGAQVNVLEGVTGTAPIVVGAVPGKSQAISMPAATTSAAGHMAAADKLALDRQSARPAARAARGTVQAVAHNTLTVISFSAATFDSAAFWTSAAPTRLTVPAGLGGLYLCGLAVTFANVTGGARRAAAIRRNGGTVIAAAEQVPPVSTAGYPQVATTTIYRLAAGDFLDSYAFQDSGGAIDLTANADYAPVLWLARLGD